MVLRCKMARFDERSGNLYVTELGRVASHYYIRHASIVAYNELLKPRMSEAEVRTPGPGTHVLLGAFRAQPHMYTCFLSFISDLPPDS